jgi:hypothetical protein
MSFFCGKHRLKASSERIQFAESGSMEVLRLISYAGPGVNWSGRSVIPCPADSIRRSGHEAREQRHAKYQWNELTRN